MTFSIEVETLIKELPTPECDKFRDWCKKVYHGYIAPEQRRVINQATNEKYWVAGRYNSLIVEKDHV